MKTELSIKEMAYDYFNGIQERDNAIRARLVVQPKQLTCRTCSMKPFSCPGCNNAPQMSKD